MELDKAREKAESIIKILRPFCDQVEIVGSVRREKETVDVIDILAVPKGALLFGLMRKLMEMGTGSMKIGERKRFNFNGIATEVWFATLDNWPIMLLIKTGSEKHNKKIMELLKKKKYSLSTGQGVILKDGRKELIFDERDIFDLLEIKYLEPKERE